MGLAAGVIWLPVEVPVLTMRTGPRSQTLHVSFRLSALGLFPGTPEPSNSVSTC